MSIANLSIIGINHHTTSSELRSSLAITSRQLDELRFLAVEKGFKNFVIISTCNRFEIISTETFETITQILTAVFPPPFLTLFTKQKFLITGEEALEHLFALATGLDSQIIGDAEILGQCKKSVQDAKDNHVITSFLERIFSTIFQAAKEVKTVTKLSSGTVSNAYAIVRIVKSHPWTSPPKILVIGLGEIGTEVLKNLSSHFPLTNIFIANRTLKTATEFSKKHNVSLLAFENIYNRLHEFDVVISAANLEGEKLLTAEHIHNDKFQYYIDLSIPFSIETSIGLLPNKKILTIDDLSAIITASLSNRKLEIVHAKAIINKHKERLYEWYFAHKHRKHIITIREELYKMYAQSENNDFVIRKKIDENIKQIIQENYETNQFDVEKILQQLIPIETKTF